MLPRTKLDDPFMPARMKPLNKFKVAIDPRCTRIEHLIELGMLSPQILSSDEVRELSQRVKEYISAMKAKVAPQP